MTQLLAKDRPAVVNGLKRPELLAPAGSLEKLKIAIHYGADAVYIGAPAYGLRSRARNFDYAEMKEGIDFAHDHGAKIYCATNMITHVGDEKGAGEFFRTIRDLGIDAVIISDPALMQIAATEALGLEMHLSTQQSAVNYETLNFWQDAGLTRCVLGREVSMAEIEEIRANTSVEIEAFIHGAMCISYSGRCTLSNYMANRDANRGGCCQSCRWRYGLFDMVNLDDKQEIRGQQAEFDAPFAMSAVDLSMIEHIPDIVNAGIDSLKIEGRMKSIHYVSTVCNVYRKAIDSYLEDPEHYELKQEWVDELWKTAYRELATGFFYGQPTDKEQIYGEPRKIRQYRFIAEVMDYDPETQIATVQQRYKFEVGDEVEFYGPGLRHQYDVIEEIWNEDGNPVTEAPQPMAYFKIRVNHPVEPHDMIRKADPEAGDTAE